jgi:hypothetical protein
MGKYGKHRNVGNRTKNPAGKNNRRRYVQISLAVISHMFQNLQSKNEIGRGISVESVRCVYSQNKIFSKSKYKNKKVTSKENDKRMNIYVAGVIEEQIIVSLFATNVIEFPIIMELVETASVV